MTIKSTQEKFIHELGDVYDAEHQFLKGQQEMLAQASDPQLQTMIQQHITQSQGQVQNLEQVFDILGQKPKAVKCAAAAGLVSEAQSNFKEADSELIRDCLIAGAADKVEHYEIASYRGLIVGAMQMNQPNIVNLLESNLRQEEQTAQKIEESTPQLVKKAMHLESQQGAAKV